MFLNVLVKKKNNFMTCLTESNFNNVHDYDSKCCLKNKATFKNPAFCKFLTLKLAIHQSKIYRFLIRLLRIYLFIYLFVCFAGFGPFSMCFSSVDGITSIIIE